MPNFCYIKRTNKNPDIILSEIDSQYLLLQKWKELFIDREVARFKPTGGEPLYIDTSKHTLGEAYKIQKRLIECFKLLGLYNNKSEFYFTDKYSHPKLPRPINKIDDMGIYKEKNNNQKMDITVLGIFEDKKNKEPLAIFDINIQAEKRPNSKSHLVKMVTFMPFYFKDE